MANVYSILISPLTFRLSLVLDGAADETVGGGISADVKIQLGGVLSGSASAAVSKGFRGVLSGVVLNGVRLLELSAERGDIVVQGDATRLQSLAQSKYSPAHNYPADQPFMLNVSPSLLLYTNKLIQHLHYMLDEIYSFHRIFKTLA